MLVHSRMACPEQQPDGSWKVIVKEFDEEIPDLGRHCMMCNKCGEKTYPKCTEWCPAELNRQEREVRAK